MTGDTAVINDDLREKILSDPGIILEDRDVMGALVAANEQVMGDNIVDLRGIAMERLEARLDRLEETHRNVIAAAYENLAGMNQIHRAVLRLLDPSEFESFLENLNEVLPEILRIDAMQLVLESAVSADDPAVQRLSKVLTVAEPGFIEGYLTQGRNIPVRQVTLRQVQPDSQIIYGQDAEWIRSEGCLKLDLGKGRLPGMLVLGSEDPHQFKPAHGTDLLTFFAGVFERAMRRWLS
ncbi:hypothetical protein AIOL_001410 [Candidatus Rhodobacter oscarellae]|uniref:Recombinase XerC n=1 Tax=Candidatus Rhodobacter oscarellae TaxID=1675527 RepID=A0A0J9E0I6_9RHOB|nr:DUF484 family protein [Candidatus Rhodobacter lobularis]KMW56456.1 hypothetical protein AIOL_001410 [Candidatus Rhodobacter lobularis]